MDLHPALIHDILEENLGLAILLHAAHLGVCFPSVLSHISSGGVII